MQSTNIDTLPYDIIYTITQFASSSKSLAHRLVCKNFNDAISAQTYSELFFGNKKKDSEKFLGFLEGLSSGAHYALEYTTTIQIWSLALHFESITIGRQFNVFPDRKTTSISQVLIHGLSAFKKVHTVIWYHFGEPLHNDVIFGLAQMPSLQSLELTMGARAVKVNPKVQLDTLPPLQNITLYASLSDISQCGGIQGLPELISKSSDRLFKLHIELYDRWAVKSVLPTLDTVIGTSPPLNITHLILKGYLVHLNSTIAPHLQSLVSLSMTDFDDEEMRNICWKGSAVRSLPVHVDDIWKGLQREKIRLRKVEVDEPSESLIDYLKSYSGLKEISILISLSVPNKVVNELGAAFYSLITMHQGLQKITTTPSYEGEWCLGTHNINIFSSFVNLTHLSISIMTSQSKLFMTASGWEAFEKNGRPVCPHYLTTPVESLMKVLSRLPNFELLSLNAALKDPNSNEGWLWHTTGPRQQIHYQIISFGPLDPSKYRFDIKNCEKSWFKSHYKLHHIVDGGGYWYQKV